MVYNLFFIHYINVKHFQQQQTAMKKDIDLKWSHFIYS